MTDCDVAVVGAGPAGCAAAIALRRAGCSVVLLDAGCSSEPGGEASSPALAALLGNIGAGCIVGTACTPCFGILADWGGRRAQFSSSIASAYGHGFLVDRGALDLGLQGIASGLGVGVRKSRVTSVTRRAHGVLIRMRGSEPPIAARAVVDATGRHAGIARQLGARRDSLDAMVAVWRSLPMRSDESIVRIEATTDGWWYAVPTTKARSTIGFVTGITTVRERGLWKPDRWFDALRATSTLSPLVHAEAKPAVVEVASAGSSRLDRLAGDSWLAVGDAAMTFDPLASAGVAKALASGTQGGHALARFLGGDDRDLVSYLRRAAALFHYYERQREARYGLGLSWSMLPFWKTRSAGPVRGHDHAPH